MDDQETRPSKNTRKEAKLEWLKHIKQGIKLEYEHILGVPNGLNSTKLVAFVGKLAKDGHYFPFDVQSWPHIPELGSQIEKVKDEIKNIFHWNEESNYWLRKILNDRWRKNKYRQKSKHFSPYSFTNVEEWYSKCPPKVIASQWENMVEYWLTIDFKKMSKRNTENRENLIDNHTAGGKSFLKYAKEIEAETGITASRHKIYMKTHKMSNNVSKERMSQMDELKRKAVENNASFEESLDQLDDDIYSQVMGPEKAGRCRGVGIGVKPKKKGGGYATTSNNDEEIRALREEVQQFHQEREDIQREREELQKAREEMQKSSEEMNKKMDKMIDFFSLRSAGQDISSLFSTQH